MLAYSQCHVLTVADDAKLEGSGLQQVLFSSNVVHFR